MSEIPEELTEPDPNCDGGEGCRCFGWVDWKDEWGYGPDGEIVDLR